MKPTPSPRKGLKIGELMLLQTIAMPLALVAADVASDGNLIFFMKSYIDTLRATNTTSLTKNSTDDNVTEQQNSTTSTETGNQQQGEDALDGLLMASCAILLASMLNLIGGNPFKTLIRNARTSALMASREMESKDVPLPLGEYFIN